MACHINDGYFGTSDKSYTEFTAYLQSQVDLRPKLPYTNAFIFMCMIIKCTYSGYCLTKFAQVQIIDSTNPQWNHSTKLC